MNAPDELEDEMPAEINFSGGVRGKFYRPNARLNLPACPDGNENLHVPAKLQESGELGN